ncbi:MAG: YesL family protein, partial [Acutalibacter sp.]|nr:YesL family protein [Acutalibacter sp.]
MGAFQYDNPLMSAMVRIANMMIVSFFWALCCLPVVTVIPATAALFHTTTKVLRENGNGVAGDYFR